MKIKYNAPVILTYTIISILVLALWAKPSLTTCFISPCFLAFLIIAILFIDNDVISILRINQISQLKHLAGGCVGGIYGFLQGGRK